VRRRRIQQPSSFIHFYPRPSTFYLIQNSASSIRRPAVTQIPVADFLATQAGCEILMLMRPINLAALFSILQLLCLSAKAGTVVGWGSYMSSPSGAIVPMVPPSDLTNVVAIAAGGTFGLALRDNGTVAAWGNGDYGKLAVPTDLTNAVAIAAGSGHCVALRVDGTVAAWGWNYHGQSIVPTGLSNVISIAAGQTYTLALKEDGTIIFWGADSAGQGQIPSDLTNVVAIAGGSQHCLALKSDGRVVAWGWNTGGQTNVPLDVTNVVAIACGASHCLAVTPQGRVRGWGANNYGQATVPASATNALAVAGASHSIALKSNGKVVAWGLNNLGQSSPPATLSNVVAVSIGGAFSLALVGDAPLEQLAQLSNPTFNAGVFSAALTTQNGHVYALESRDSLAQGAWTRMPLIPGCQQRTNITDLSATNYQQFYRVRKW